MYGERIRVEGRVQGVGFRPFIWKLARSLDIKGCVKNDAQGVIIEVWGTDKPLLDEFRDRIVNNPPKLARIDVLYNSALSEPTNCSLEKSFSILPSDPGPLETQVTDDAIICDQCVSEIFDPNNRHYFYPFTNCTQCGPRFSIIKAMPYDRKYTSMSEFTMCAECNREYQSPKASVVTGWSVMLQILKHSIVCAPES